MYKLTQNRDIGFDYLVFNQHREHRHQPMSTLSNAKNRPA